MAGMEDIVGKTGNYNVRDKFKRFDNKFIRPLILKHIQVSKPYADRESYSHFRKISKFIPFFFVQQSAEPKILETYSKLTMKDAMDFMHRNPSTIGQMTGTESMSALFRNYTAGGMGMAGRLAPPFVNPW